MNAYRLVIYRHGRLLGRFGSETPWAKAAAHIGELPAGIAKTLR
ncbi:hypothetical protein [Thiorhodococcus fuscus]|uniref:Uncharacterized protein n=1 Tax=Thiorhodococcus fuscus TaxID=527200 RepID=A0ABW4Y953_9GAMM